MRHEFAGLAWDGGHIRLPDGAMVAVEVKVVLP